MERTREIYGYFNSRLRGEPFFVLYRMTRACNLKCRMCSVWHQKNLSSELSTDDVRRVAYILKRLRIPYIVLTGGDPFLKKDIMEIIKIFSDAGLHTRIETNGGKHVTKEVLERAVDAGIMDYSTSLDTLDKDKQDRICNSKGVWQYAVDSLKYAIKKFPGILPHVNIVISHYNLHELPDLVKFIDSLGAYCTLAPVVLGDEKDNPLFKGYDKTFLFDDNDKEIARDIYDELLQMKKDGIKILNSSRFLNESVDFIKTGNIKWNCDGGKLYLEIFPDGEVGLCNEVGYGENILEGDFVKRFKSKEYKKRVKELRAQCVGCTYPVFREPSYHFRYYSVLWEMMKRYFKEMGYWD